MSERGEQGLPFLFFLGVSTQAAILSSVCSWHPTHPPNYYIAHRPLTSHSINTLLFSIYQSQPILYTKLVCRCCCCCNGSKVKSFTSPVELSCDHPASQFPERQYFQSSSCRLLVTCEASLSRPTWCSTLGQPGHSLSPVGEHSFQQFCPFLTSTSSCTI